MKTIVVGSLESSDCLITLQPNENTEINIESTVFAMYGEQIQKVLTDTLKAHNIENIHVLCQDKGALDYTIEARLITAIKRFKEAKDES